MDIKEKTAWCAGSERIVIVVVHKRPRVRMKAAPEAEDARWWCCPLRGLVLVLAVLLASLYTVTIAAASVIWVLHAQAGHHTAGTVVEVSSQPSNW